MPMTDSLAYLHGTGSTGQAPYTSTVNAFTAAIAPTSGATTGTMTISAIASGQITVGQQVIGPGVASNTFIVGLGTGAGGTGTYFVNNSQTVSSAALMATPNTIGDSFGLAGSQYSNNEIDFGAPNSGGAFPSIPQFPSLTEKTYVFPAEVVGQGGVDMGLHIIVTAAFNTVTSIAFSAVTAPTTGALISNTPGIVATRTLTLAQLQVVGAHYYIPVQLSTLQEFLRGYGALTGSDPTIGAITMWFGPRTGGEQ